MILAPRMSTTMATTMAPRVRGQGSRFDFYAGVVTGGKLTVMDSNGNDIANDGYKTAPAIGLTLSSRF